MPLATSQLKSSLQNIFDTAAKEQWTTAKVADQMSKAMETFVKSASVKNVKVNIQTGAQSADGTIE
ncbi:MAG: hypothetical protein JST11_14830 [Acidobacteria bacterium]|nr:hypothetical protein [Acidobacteriota bacterium]